MLFLERLFLTLGRAEAEGNVFRVRQRTAFGHNRQNAKIALRTIVATPRREVRQHISKATKPLF